MQLISNLTIIMRKVFLLGNIKYNLNHVSISFKIYKLQKKKIPKMSEQILISDSIHYFDFST